MNIKNKLFLTLIAIIFAICLFNTNCFAAEDTVKLSLPSFDEYLEEYPYYIVVETPSYYFVSLTSVEMEVYYTTTSICFITDYEVYSLRLRISKEDLNNGTNEYTLSSEDHYNSQTGRNQFTISGGSVLPTLVASNYDVFNFNDGTLIFESSPVFSERGTEDDTNTDSGETGNETTGGDSETDTDSDDSGGILSSITQGFKNIGSFFTQLIEKIGNILETIGGWFTELFTKLGDWFSGLADSIGGFFATLTNNISTFFSNLGQNITDKWNEWKQQRQEEKEQERLKEEEEKNKQNQSSQDMSNNLNTATDKFSWYNNVIQNTRDMINVITSTESSATFNVNVNSKYYKGDLAIIDLSWYAPYKEIGDNVICIFCYLSFLWSFFTRLPNILSGSGASNYSIAQIKEDSK